MVQRDRRRKNETRSGLSALANRQTALQHRHLYYRSDRYPILVRWPMLFAFVVFQDELVRRTENRARTSAIAIEYSCREIEVPPR